jgi:hypothetical protein
MEISKGSVEGYLSIVIKEDQIVFPFKNGSQINLEMLGSNLHTPRFSEISVMVLISMCTELQRNMRSLNVNICRGSSIRLIS